MAKKDEMIKLLNLPEDKYIVSDISAEQWREVDTGDRRYRIEKPQVLIIRKGGSTHRVVDSEGVAHCYASPESGKTILRWKNKEGKTPVNF